MKKVVTLEDFEIRYKNIRKSKPDIERCSVVGCKNPRDSTKYLGKDTSCAYHRILFDYWFCEVVAGDRSYYYLGNQRARRAAFTRWRNKVGKEACNRIVLKMAQDPINWEC